MFVVKRIYRSFVTNSIKVVYKGKYFCLSRQFDSFGAFEKVDEAVEHIKSRSLG